eukprot:889525-Pleurochrysis_carterae.AAC.2
MRVAVSISFVAGSDATSRNVFSCKERSGVSCSTVRMAFTSSVLGSCSRPLRRLRSSSLVPFVAAPRSCRAFLSMFVCNCITSTASTLTVMTPSPAPTHAEAE